MSTTLPSDMKLGIVKLYVSNLERSIRFYQEIVGLRLGKSNTTSVELTVDGSTPFLMLEEMADARVTPRRSAAGLYHFAILLPTRKDLGLSLNNLIQSGIHIGQADHLVSEALYITDPDHNGIEIYCDRPRSEWRRDALGNYIMASDPIDWDGLLSEAEGTEWSGLPAGTTMGHIHFHVKNLQKSKEFYCDLLGFDVVADARETMRALFISAGGYHHHIGLNVWAGEEAPSRPANGTGLDYYTLVFPNEQTRNEAIDRLKHAGVLVAEIDETVTVTDPSGIQLRLVYDK
ncbi:VOC family protein [Paenibacillus aceris]|uniref:Catechol 2,3-dioxygenase n=1 Tax=Paenibacillus aceris TaxID=869555 RepID=A0ABS4I0G0_9BACL|nr:VOC family protein [Paenibacillus aceris]MBP1964414.1 catechol 2,3-dioxygenase [Paenibacillus aceris]NHW35872.1 VOC family protein [Paenibacillus aceris]